MEAEGILTTLAEIAVAIAGFSGIVVALQGRQGAWSETDRGRFSLLVQLSLSSVFWSLIPIVFHLIDSSESFVWRWSSGLWLVSTSCVVLIRLRSLPRPSESELDRSYRAALAFMFSILTISVVLQIANAGWLRVSWPYIMSLMLGLLNASFLFVRLLRGIFGPAAPVDEDS